MTTILGLTCISEELKDKDNYGLYEVMYNDDGEIFAHSENAEVIGDSPEDLLDTKAHA